MRAENKRGPVVWDRNLRCYPQALRLSPRVGQSWRLRLAQKLSAAGEVFFNSIDDSIDQGSGKRRGEGIETSCTAYGFGRRTCMPSETKVSFGVHPCTVRQWGHWENVTLSGSLSMSARSISILVETSLFVFGHWNINFVNGTSTCHRRRSAELMRFGTSGAQWRGRSVIASRGDKRSG